MPFLWSAANLACTDFHHCFLLKLQLNNTNLSNCVVSGRLSALSDQTQTQLDNAFLCAVLFWEKACAGVGGEF